MTRLRQPERQVLDTLVDAGRGPVPVRGAGLVRALVGEHAEEWLTELREAMGAVDRLRAQGPDVGGPEADSGPEPTES